MALEKLSFFSLETFDGASLKTAWDLAVAALVKDCQERPHDRRDRRIVDFDRLVRRPVP